MTVTLSTGSACSAGSRRSDPCDDASDHRAVAAGLTTRPLEQTVEDALRWEQELGVARRRLAGLSPARERQLLGLLG